MIPLKKIRITSENWTAEIIFCVWAILLILMIPLKDVLGLSWLWALAPLWIPALILVLTSAYAYIGQIILKGK
jgi:hypothetical protein